MADRVIQRNDSSARWKEVNPVLAMGEIGIETDGAKGYKIGDGKTGWNDLAYPANPTSVVQEGGTSETAVMSQKAVSERLIKLEKGVAYIEGGDAVIEGRRIEESLIGADGNIDNSSVSHAAFHIVSINVADIEEIKVSLGEFPYGSISYAFYDDEEIYFTNLVGTAKPSKELIGVDVSVEVPNGAVQFSITCPNDVSLSIKGVYRGKANILEEQVNELNKEINEQIVSYDYVKREDGEQTNKYPRVSLMMLATDNDVVSLIFHNAKNGDRFSYSASMGISHPYAEIALLRGENVVEVLYDVDWMTTPSFSAIISSEKEFDSIIFVGYKSKPTVVYESIVSVTIKERIDSLEKNNGNILLGKKAVFFGDSITQGDGYGWAGALADKYGVISDNRGQGGTTIKNNGSNSIISKFESFVNGGYMSDYFILSGGFNELDWSAPYEYGNVTSSYPVVGSFDTTKTIGALEEICAFCAEKLKGKKYGFIIHYYLNSPAVWNGLADKMVDVFNKWAMPYLDLRKVAGFGLYNAKMRELYALDLTTGVPTYSETESYALDARVVYNGRVYKAKQALSPAGVWDESKWMVTGDENGHDNMHITREAYDILVDKIAAWMMTL